VRARRLDVAALTRPGLDPALTRTHTDDGRALLLYGRHAPVPERVAAARAATPTLERRFDELRSEEVIFAPGRQGRVHLPDLAGCPLCPARPDGHRGEIPVRSFELAVFENRSPAFAPGAIGGACEVVVYTDEHEGSFATLAPERAEDLMWVWRDRYAELGARADVAYVMPFENRGVEVGVTLHHPHGQIYAFPFLPPVAAAEREADERRRGCTPCALAAAELTDGRRLVHCSRATVAFVPYAARWPYEVHVVMREHRPSLLDCSPAELRDLATALQAVTRGYDALFDRPFPYMLCVHQAPTDGRGGGHLHVELYPPLRSADRFKHLAGCEQGAGVSLNDTLPEHTAAELRDALAQSG
jgi:UDPglucose--hexose-1-phosphate uridylyltransferase